MTKPVPEQADYASLAKIVRDMARTVATLPPADVEQREALRDAAKALYLELASDTRGISDEDDIASMTSEEEVRLLHIME